MENTDSSFAANRIINKIMTYAEKKLSKSEAALFGKFLLLYFSNMALEDLEARDVADWYALAFSHWQLLEQRKPNELKIRVFNPSDEASGWLSTHTVIQVLVDDMPFLVDSTHMELNRLGLSIYLTIHTGGIAVVRNAQGDMKDVLSAKASEEHQSCRLEAPIYIEINRQTSRKKLADILRNLKRVLRDVRMAVKDWPLMQDQMRKVITQMDKNPLAQSSLSVMESKEFLKWMLNEHFTFLGYRYYACVGQGGKTGLKLSAQSGLGVLRNTARSKAFRQFSDMPEAARDLLLSKDHMLLISKTNTISSVHRATYTDYVGIKCFDEKGELIGEHRFIGLYTSSAYSGDPKLIPMVRHKVEAAVERSGLQLKSHAGKDLTHILSTLPRDDLFQGTVDELYDLSMGILHLQERRKVRLFIRKDAYGRFLSCFVYVPRDNFTTDLVLQMQKILQEKLNGIYLSFSTHFSESILARIHYLVRTDPDNPPTYDPKAIEALLSEVGRSWRDGFRDAVIDYFGEERGTVLFSEYQRAFPSAYREVFTPFDAVLDLEEIERLPDEGGRLGMSFYRSRGAKKEAIRFKLFNHDHTVPLSDALPLLENMGLRVIDEQPYKITLPTGRQLWINDFGMNYRKEPNFEVEEVREIFQDAFRRVWFNEAESDDFNRLILEGKLTWREIAVLRTYTRYLRQVGFTLSEPYIAKTLVSHPQISRLLVDLFKARFNPLEVNEAAKACDFVMEHLKVELEKITVLDEDRIFSNFISLIQATLRTNYFQLNDDGEPKAYLSFKFAPEKIPNLPLPLPKYETFVYSPRFEGVHLRAAKVARGGLRWSDRCEDFRTEVLGLMKAQQVKNAVIVPAGAKGGFCPKRLPVNGSREEILQEGIACYQDFIRGLLDLSDNIQKGKVVSPKNTVCYDYEDPYLVVAADKGTAAFSDIANQIAIERGYWLGDAFASGGCVGYDHKKMGITARGAWVSAQRHFQELGVNVDSADITVVGIGDMSGDVFGNGMLMSSAMKLVAAFNHQHIFLDPEPDAATSYEERQRLFNLPRSSWDDYDRSIISEGGGVYSRASKAIVLSPQVQKLLKVSQDKMLPNDLIRALLRAPVDMIWNGGIGTYVKASTETHRQVGDRTNDVVRVNGNELRARVVCEGGNLGLTQLGRIEYALSGGRLNTDFIDNSAGVDCSDHEVNIKILLNVAVASGDMTERQRNALLSRMTDEVAELVLRDNYLQNEAISLAAHLAPLETPLYRRFIVAQEQAGLINRQLEFLPSDKAIVERRALGKTLTRPELSILFAYSKIILEESLKKTDLLSDPHLSAYLENAFPTPLRKRFSQKLSSHYLANQIIATQLGNQLVSDMGITFIYQMHDETGMSVSDIVRAYVAAAKIFAMHQVKLDIEALDYKIEVASEYEMHLAAVRLVRRAVRWLLRNRRECIDVGSIIDYFSESVNEIYKRLPKLLLGEDRQNLENRYNALLEQGVPLPLAYRIAAAPPMYHALNIVEAAKAHDAEVFRVAKIYFMLADRLNLIWFRDLINTYPAESNWSLLARASYKADLDWVHRELTMGVLRVDPKIRSIPGKINAWLKQNELLVQRWERILEDLRRAESQEFAILFVALRELMDLAKASSADSKATRTRRKQGKKKS